MATHDYVIANASGAAVRSDLNNALAAIVSNNSSATEPATTYSFMWWYDTTNGQLKQRNAANDDWNIAPTFDSSGNLGIGTTSPSVPVTVGLDGPTGPTGITGTNTVGVFANTALNRGLGLNYDATNVTAGIYSLGSNSKLVFYTPNGSTYAERVRIAENGTVTFDGAVTKTGNQGWLLAGSNATAHSLSRNTSNTGTGSILNLESQSRIGYIFRANGTAEKYGGTSWTSLSDRRSKENVVNFETGLDEVKSVNPVIFSYVGDSNRYVGVIAQDIENVIPYSVSQREGELPDGTEVDDLRTFDSTSLQFAMLNAIKEMAAHIEQLETRITALEAAD